MAAVLIWGMQHLCVQIKEVFVQNPVEKSGPESFKSWSFILSSLKWMGELS